MSGIKNLLIDLFGENKIKSDINPDEAVAIGATLEAAKIQREKNLNFVLQDIIPFDIGVLIQNPNVNDPVHREIIHPIIQRYSKIPSSNEKRYKVKYFYNDQLSMITQYDEFKSGLLNLMKTEYNLEYFCEGFLPYDYLVLGLCSAIIILFFSIISICFYHRNIIFCF